SKQVHHSFHVLFFPLICQKHATPKMQKRLESSDLRRVDDLFKVYYKQNEQINLRIKYV
ncbi:hypothetical protein S245_042749, partial [Arachis hypogaea]